MRHVVYGRLIKVSCQQTRMTAMLRQRLDGQCGNLDLHWVDSRRLYGKTIVIMECTYLR